MTRIAQLVRMLMLWCIGAIHGSRGPVPSPAGGLSMPEPPPPPQHTPPLPTEIGPSTQAGTGVTAQAPPFVPPSPRGGADDGHIGLPIVGQTVNDFHLLEVLGAGSFARVFLARQVSL